jgi:hypothetical protein
LIEALEKSRVFIEVFPRTDRDTKLAREAALLFEGKFRIEVFEGGMATAIVGVSPVHSFTRDSICKSPTALSGSGINFSSSQLFGQTVGVAAAGTYDSSNRSFVSSPRAHTATEEQRFTSRSGPARRSLYESLGVCKTATAKEIKTVYRLAARRLHPDVVPESQRQDATKAFLEIQKTYAILSDPHRRAAYDLSLTMNDFQSSGFSNKGPVTMTMTPSWGFMSTPASSPRPYSSGSDSVFRGSRWETDQCW